MAEDSCGYRVHPLLRDWLDTTAPPLAGRPVLLAGGAGDAAALITAGAAVQRWPHSDDGPGGTFALVAVVDYLQSLVESERRDVARRLANAVAPRGVLLLIGRSGATPDLPDHAELDLLRQGGLVLDTYEDLDTSTELVDAGRLGRYLRVTFRRPAAPAA